MMTPPLVRCALCEIHYPEDLLAEFRTAHSADLLCGICALAQTNTIHGTRLRRFAGARAEALRQAAVHWRAGHGQGDPTPGAAGP